MFVAGWAVQKSCGNVIVTVGKDGGGDCYVIAERSFRRVPPSVDLRLDLFDNHPAATFARFHAD